MKLDLQLVRKYFLPTYTIGKLYVGDFFYCDTLEDKYRDLTKEEKVYGQTAIPFGTYKVIMSMSGRFGRILPELLQVEHFSSIRIHSGNFTEDTEGCILVGRNTIKGGLTNSRYYSDRLNVILSAYDDIEITIV